jgi:hypothetical protein
VTITQNERAFIGPLPAGLRRDETGEVGLGWSFRTAEEFVLAVANLMRLRGRQVEVTRETSYGYESVSAFSPGANWYDHPVHVLATRRVDRAGARWRLGAATSWGFTAGESRREVRGYRAVRSFVEVYGR